MKAFATLFFLLTAWVISFPATAGEISIPLNPDMEAADMDIIQKEESAIAECAHSLSKPSYTALVCLANREKALRQPYSYIAPALGDIQEQLISDFDILSQDWGDRSFLAGHQPDDLIKKSRFTDTELEQLIVLETEINTLLHDKKELLQKSRPALGKALTDQANMWDIFLFGEKALLGRLREP